MHESTVSEFIFFLVHLLNPGSDHDSPWCCIQRSKILVKLTRKAPDPNPDIHEFLVKLNPKFSDPDAFTRIGFSSMHIFFLAAAPDIWYKKRRDFIISSYIIRIGSVFGPCETKSYEAIIYIPWLKRVLYGDLFIRFGLSHSIHAARDYERAVALVAASIVFFEFWHFDFPVVSFPNGSVWVVAPTFDFLSADTAFHNYLFLRFLLKKI